MSVPKLKDKMIKNAMKRRNKEIKQKCERQFPDCPKEANKEFCKRCPFWKK